MSEIKGYKPLSDEQKASMNLLKELEGTLLTALKRYNDMPEINKRWVSIARTHFEQGFMAAVRAIAQPQTIEF